MRCGLNVISHLWSLSRLLLIFHPKVPHPEVGAIAVVAATPTTTEVGDLPILAVAEVHISHMIWHNLHVPSASFVGSGHTAPRCYQRPDPALAGPPSAPYHPAQAYYYSPNLPTEENWYLDTGATHHLTNNLQNLNISSEEYSGQDQIRIGNGTSLSISHSSSATLSLSRCKFLLTNCFMFLTSAKIFSQSVSLLLTMMFSLSFTPLFLSLRIGRPNCQFITANLRMVFITSSLRKCVHPHCKHSLVRGLHKIGTNVWAIQPFGLSTLSYPNFSFLFCQIRHRFPTMSVLRQRVTNCPF